MIGIDFDIEDRSYVEKMLFFARLLHLYQRGKVLSIRRTHKGFHVYLDLKNPKARFFLFDDPMRILIDEDRERKGLYIFTDTLFQSKVDHEYGYDEKEINIWEAEKILFEGKLYGESDDPAVKRTLGRRAKGRHNKPSKAERRNNHARSKEVPEQLRIYSERG